LKATNTDVVIAKYPISQTPIFKEKKFQFFENTENGSKITTLLTIKSLH